MKFFLLFFRVGSYESNKFNNFFENLKFFSIDGSVSNSKPTGSCPEEAVTTTLSPPKQEELDKCKKANKRYETALIVTCSICITCFIILCVLLICLRKKVKSWKHRTLLKIRVIEKALD